MQKHTHALLQPPYFNLLCLTLFPQYVFIHVVTCVDVITHEVDTFTSILYIYIYSIYMLHILPYECKTALQAAHTQHILLYKVSLEVCLTPSQELLTLTGAGLMV